MAESKAAAQPLFGRHHAGMFHGYVFLVMEEKSGLQKGDFRQFRSRVLNKREYPPLEHNFLTSPPA